MAEGPKYGEESKGVPGPAVEAPAMPAKSAKRQTTSTRTPPKQLPRYKLLLHNDDKNTTDRVILVIVRLTPLNATEALQKMLEAHNMGVSLLLVTHKELAELYHQQFTSAGLHTTIEPE